MDRRGRPLRDAVVDIRLDETDPLRATAVRAAGAAGLELAEPQGPMGPRLVLSRGAPPAFDREFERAIAVVEDRDAAQAAIAAGASAAVDGTISGDRLASVLATVMAGFIVVESQFVPAVVRPALTPREKQVLALVVMGFTNAEIAERLVVSLSTVKSHLFSAYRRLGVNTRTEAVAAITDPVTGHGSGILSIPRAP